MKSSIKRISLLGLVLMAAAAATAAVLSGNTNGRRVNNGSIRLCSGSGWGPNGVPTCVDDVDTVDSCTATVSDTSEVGQDESTIEGLQTVGNTSQTAGQPGDQNSVLVGM
jgi:hypothetical protein